MYTSSKICKLCEKYVCLAIEIWRCPNDSALEDAVAVEMPMIPNTPLGPLLDIAILWGIENDRNLLVVHKKIASQTPFEE